MRLRLCLLSVFLCVACESETPSSPPANVKRVVEIQAIETRYMENADGSVYGLGENLYHRLLTDLDGSNNFVVIINESLQRSSQASTPENTSDRLHFNFAPFPAARFSASVEGLSFASGSKGLNQWTGFRPEFRTAWNDASIGAKNEFILRSLELNRSWFGTNFDPIGTLEDNTISGVNAGAEGELNLLVAGLHYRRDHFVSTAFISSNIELLQENQNKKVDFEAVGHGFLFAMGINYQALSVELGMQLEQSRKLVFDLSVEKMSQEIQKELAKIPFRTKVEQVGSEGIIINAGRRENIAVGSSFSLATNASRKYQVKELFQIGAIVVPLNNAGLLAAGEVLVLQDSNKTNSAALASTKQSIQAEKHQIIIEPPELLLPNGDAATALRLKQGLMLPYYLWRFARYDQTILQTAPAHHSVNILQAAQSQWNLQSIGITEAWRLTRGAGVKVAILDTGVDYNHKDLYAAFERQAVGWDFYSWDERPFDDNSHGTAIAGIIAGRGSDNGAVGVAPEAQLLAYKAINPYGETQSAALYGAAVAAIEAGARILVLAWDTGLNTRTLEAIVRLAEEKNVLLVTAAGDQGKDLHQFVRYPASYSNSANVITVAALGKNGSLTQIQGRFSNYGGGIVDIAAPGEAIQTLAPRSQFLSRNGSDLAAAHVAGVAALVLSVHPDISAAEIKSHILSGASTNRYLTGFVSGGRVLQAASSL